MNEAAFARLLNDLKTAADDARKLAVLDKQKADEDAAKALVLKMEAEVARVEADKAKVVAMEAAIVAKEAALVAKNEKAQAEKDKKKADYKALLADASRSFFEGSYGDTRKKLNSLKKDYEELCDVEWEQLMNAASAPDTVSLPRPALNLTR